MSVTDQTLPPVVYAPTVAAADGPDGADRIRLEEMYGAGGRGR